MDSSLWSLTIRSDYFSWVNHIVTVCFELKPTSTFLLHVFLFLFFFSSPQLLTLSIVNSVSVYCSRSPKLHFLATFLLKMGLTTLFIHLKLFRYSVFSFSKNKLNPNTPIVNILCIQVFQILTGINSPNPKGLWAFTLIPYLIEMGVEVVGGQG